MHVQVPVDVCVFVLVIVCVYVCVCVRRPILTCLVLALTHATQRNLYAAVVSPGGTAVIRTKAREKEVGGQAFWEDIYGSAEAGNDDDDEDDF